MRPEIVQFSSLYYSFLAEAERYVLVGCNKTDPYSPPVLSCFQFLLDLLQGQVPLWGVGNAVGSISHRGRRLQDDLKGLA